jgi:hypothetical protein
MLLTEGVPPLVAEQAARAMIPTRLISRSVILVFIENSFFGIYTVDGDASRKFPQIRDSSNPFSDL